MKIKILGSILSLGMIFFSQNPVLWADTHRQNPGVLMEQGAFEPALVALTQTIQKGSRDPGVYSNRGLAHYHLKHYLKSLKDYGRSIKLDPRNPVAYNGLGMVYADIWDNDKALTAFAKAIALNPEYSSPYVNRGNVLAGQARYALAMADYDKAIELDAKEPKGFFNRGTAFLKQGDLDAAVRDLNQAILLDSEFAEGYSNLGFAYHMKGQYKAAVDAYDKALDLDPGLTGVLARRELSILSQCTPADAKAAEGFALKFIHTYEVAKVMAKKMPVKKRAPKVKANYKLLDVVCDGGAAYVNRGIEFSSQGNYQMALMDFNNAIQMNPDNGKAFHHRGMIYQKIGDHAQAKADLALAKVLGTKGPFTQNCCSPKKAYLRPCVNGAGMLAE